MPVVPVLPPVGTGVGSSSFLSAVEAAVAFLQKPPVAELIQIAAESIPASAFTALTFTAHLVDQDYLGGTGHSDSVNTSRYTANYAGQYQLSGAASFVANATGRRGSSWFVNGTQASGGTSLVAATAASDGQFPARTKHQYLNVGDYVELMAFQESGGALSTITTFAGQQPTASIRWVSN